MKKIYSILLLFAFFVGCKEEDKVQIGGSDTYTPPVISEGPSTDSVYVFEKDSAENTFTTMSWSAANFGVSTQVNYNIAVTVEGYEGVGNAGQATGPATSITLTQKAVNEQIIAVTGIVTEAALDTFNVTLSVVASMSNESVLEANTTSEGRVVKIFPYFEAPLPANKMYVRGNHNGWAENDPTTILGSAAASGGPYVGYMYLDGAFKVCTEATWSGTNYGASGDWTAVDGGLESMALDAEGGDIPNPTGSPAMFYLDTDGGTKLTVEPLSFVITGSGVASDVVMEWDPQNRVLFANTTFSDGTITFKGSDNHNLGAGENEGIVVNGGDPIEVTAGEKQLSLDLKNPASLVYYFSASIERTAPVLATPDSTTLRFAKDDKDNVIQAFSWSAAVFGEESITSYELFLGGQSIYSGTDLTVATLTTEAVNRAALDDGGSADQAGTHNLKVVANFASGAQLESDVIELTITPYQAYPTELWMTGGALGGWDWNTAYDVQLIPVANHPERFWAIVYLTAGQGGVKISPDRAWTNDFGGSDENDTTLPRVETIGGSNINVPTTGYYTIVVDYVKNQILVQEPDVYLIGQAVGSWDSENPANKFTIDNGNTKLTITKTLVDTQPIRMYTAASFNGDVWLGGGDWWQSEFNIFNGMIEYRGAGGDQTAVPATGGENVIDLNFSDNTGSISPTP
ncbi:SusF/SusE family outer membrane protein [Flammeovirga yaeyamensis]|uniref:SusF/SusE family outer membrane protein n=1 Tax=Flammeovirga yaeyamensis TaxID=367791 RepID=A0AAX1MZ35_9BACT|nr:SusF/SusE family outer membrane protein [Flammeovirga yaeyamensis]MBB3700839.1 hypothetical protein [Flammeovirga yaeyamensis]NMF37947.1 SusF/SusE family outer membrane protein [Flammeovirga yaeyamensis]QWG00599.1 SusF/SusE family outer membrane protein [Flammeovirga yaeyamensis]